MASGKYEGLGELQETLLGGGIDAEAPGEPAVVEVRGITYTVPGATRKEPPRQVLKDVSCAFPPGKLSAVMGASGSGKTSLLTLIRGLSSPGARLQGEALCNGRRVDPEKMRSISSVVPQQDVFLSALTPRETLDFAAQLRLPAKLTAAERKRRVDRILSVLRLEACADTPIGDEAQGTRGISGGEKRRLSVGISIVGDELPQLLLCDEPTSGLDSAAATSMVSILSGLAGRGVTVVCAIHQPSFAVFKEFHSLLLLEAGQTVYFGSVCGAPGSGSGAGAAGPVEAYFASHGSPTPEHVNPAHHYITEIQARGDAWAARWAANPAKQTPLAANPGQARGGKASRSRSSLSIWQQTKVLTRRTLRENFKNKKKFFRGVMSRLPASTLIGFFFWRMATPPTQHSVFPLKGVMFVAVQNPLIETFYAGAATFQVTKGLLKREYYDGLYQVVPYYLSYYIGFLAMQVPWTFAWVTPLYLLVGLPLEFRRFSIFLLTSFLVILMACAAGSVVGTRTKDADGNRAVLMPLLIPMVLFSGYVIPYDQIPVVWKPLYYASPVQWGMTLLETNQYKGLVFQDCDPSVPIDQRHCFATGDELLAATSTGLAQSLGIAGMLLICFAYIGLFMACNIRAIRTNVLDGRV
mmetsp:Transcript_73595/g.186019  ORF Transcript_73595/g.186019 Transcript_73595/m.186019 type:complete len:637 (-) Transcript_73595:45-1955(-)